jgi:DNA-binding NtrC family response regulator
VDELIATLRRGLEFRKFQAERAAAGAGPGLKPSEIETRLIGKGIKLTKLIAQVKKLATVRTPVLLIGENGTGKTSVAEILHGATGAPDTALVRIDCSLSSEAHFRDGLLGQNGEGGGWVKQARGGTLFLQHLQCLSQPVQKELVSVLRNTAHGFRLVCTTNEDLEKLVDEGKFHDELFYRVASLPVHMPPLRERADDIPLLVKHFASQAANPLFEGNLIEFTGDALSLMAAYHWPGNLSALEQVVSKIAATTETRVITSQQFPLRLRELKHWPSLVEDLAGQEKQYTDMVLHACRNDKAAAAKVLGVDVAKLG